MCGLANGRSYRKEGKVLLAPVWRHTAAQAVERGGRQASRRAQEERR